ncbi:MAG: hypothetical protein ACYTXY_18985, partial [Nostoc sp.]
MDAEALEKIHEITSELSTNLQADIFLFSGEIAERTADRLIYKARNIKERQENVILILTTYGGEADAAF